jgi:hypothetical protein
MDYDQDMRKKEGIMKEEITTQDPITQGFLVECIDITTHLLIHPEIFIHLESQGEVEKCLLLGIKEEDMIWIVYKESLGSLRHDPLMVKDKGKMMLKPCCLELGNIFSCITTHLS